MKKIILALICLFCFNVTCFADEKEVVNSFTDFTNNIISELQANFNEGVKVRKGKARSIWYKQQRTNLQASIDIQKTNSLISPYEGILEIHVDSIDYITNDNPTGNFDTEEEARNATIPSYYSDFSIDRFIYVYQGNQWKLKRVISRLKSDPTWFDSDLQTPQEMYMF